MRAEWVKYPLLVFSLALYLVLFFTPRNDFHQLLLVFVALFGLYIWLIQQFGSSSLKLLLGAAIIFRLASFLSFPLLSDDVYRFIWDGKLVAEGYNPFSSTPNEFTGDINHWGLLRLMNSPDYYSIYPPVLQGVFYTAVKAGSISIFDITTILRVFLLTAEIGAFWVMSQLLKHFNLPLKNVLWYALNPLVIVELVGNIHFEAFFIFFVLLTLWLTITKKLVWAALVFALAIDSKLIPLMFLPLFIRYLGIKKSVLFCGITLTASLLLFVPFFDWNSAKNFFESFQLYFQSFEFNASVFYVIRAIGFASVGYDPIQTVGWVLSAVVVLGIVALSFYSRKENTKKLLFLMLLAYSIYLLFATIVHPWYVIPLVAFSIFTKLKFPAVWSLLIILSYSAYQQTEVTENAWLIALEYLAVFACIAWGWREIKSCLAAT